jgi:hypothetical protein
MTYVSLVTVKTVMEMNAVLLIALCACVTHAFNLEPRIPVIKRGLEGSYFGYSVAEHIEIESSLSKSISWYVIYWHRNYIQQVFTHFLIDFLY